MRILKIILAILLLAAAGIWFARASLLQYVLMRELQARNIPVQSLRVASVAHDHILLEEVVVNAGATSITGQADIRLAWRAREAKVTLDIPTMQLAPLLAGALGEGTLVEGLMGGTIPVQVTEKGWRIDEAAMKNIGGLHVAITPGSPSAQALSSHPQADTVLGALSNFQVDSMALTLKSTDDHGGVLLNWRFVGNNPDFMGGKKVDFTLAVTANLEDILRSTASAETLAGEAESEHR